MAISFPKSSGNNIHPQSSYAGVSQQQQQTTVPPQLSALSHFADVSLSELDINRGFTTITTEITDYGDTHQGQTFHQDDDDNDSSDLEFEIEDEEEEEKQNFSEHQGDEKEEVETSQEEENHEIESNQAEDREKKLYVPTATTSSSKPFKTVPNMENKASSFTMGRGRGMVKFSSSSPPGTGHSKVDSSSRHRNLPVAKITPTERSFGTVDDFNAMFDGQNQQNHSSNWRNRDGGESNNSKTGTVSSASMDVENQEQLSWRNSRHPNNNNSNTYSSPANNNQQYRSTGESNRTHQGNNTNRKYQVRSSSNGSPNNFNNNSGNKGQYNHYQQHHHNHHHQKRGKKSWRNLDLNSTTQQNSSQYNTGDPPKIISGPPTINKNHPGRFQTSHRSKEANVAISRPKVQRNNNNTVVASEIGRGSDSGGFGFGTTKPDMCFRCSSVEHITEECTANNFFF